MRSECPECGWPVRSDHVHECRPPQALVECRARITEMERLLSRVAGAIIARGSSTNAGSVIFWLDEEDRVEVLRFADAEDAT